MPAADNENAQQQKQTRTRSSDRELFFFKSKQVIWLLTGLLEGLLGIRILLRLIGANPENAFASLVYGFTDLFPSPFHGLTGTPEANGMALEVSTIFAMLIYALAAWALTQVLMVVLTRPEHGQADG